MKKHIWTEFSKNGSKEPSFSGNIPKRADRLFFHVLNTKIYYLSFE